MHGRPHTFAVVVASVTGAAAIVVAVLMGLPLRDPDGVAGPSYVRLPLILGIIFAADLLPRAWRRAGSVRDLPAAVRAVARERWPARRVGLVVTGLAAFYVTYVGYRNLKSYLLFARDDLLDTELGLADSILFLGADPAVVLHSLLGTGVAAYVLSWVYVSYMIFVPVTLAAALVWSRDISRGFWYVTALCLNWTLGAASYYLIPALGPVYVDPENFQALPDTSVSALQDALWNSRLTVFLDPWATGSVHGVAAFASLHVSVIFTAAYFAHRVGLRRPIRLALWGYLGLTVLATVYFGWHYVVDDIAGAAIGWLAVTLSAFATGNAGTRRNQPQTVTPDTLAPDTLAPDTLAPDTLAPDTLAPDTLAPDTLEADTVAADRAATTAEHDRLPDQRRDPTHHALTPREDVFAASDRGERHP